MSITSQQYESYTPIYDVIPADWEAARGAITEYFKKLSDSVDEKERGWFLNQQLLSGGQFIVSPTATDNQDFRPIFRMVVNCSPLIIGLNTFAHGLTVNSNFTLVHMYAAATNNSTFVSEPIPNGADTLSMDATNIYITVAAAWPIAYCTIEFLTEP